MNAGDDPRTPLSELHRRHEVRFHPPIVLHGFCRQRVALQAIFGCGRLSNGQVVISFFRCTVIFRRYRRGWNPAEGITHGFSDPIRVVRVPRERRRGLGEWACAGRVRDVVEWRSTKAPRPSVDRTPLPQRRDCTTKKRDLDLAAIDRHGGYTQPYRRRCTRTRDQSPSRQGSKNCDRTRQPKKRSP